MTKAEMRARVTEWNKDITTKYMLKDKVFKDLQELAYVHTGVRHCSLEESVKAILTFAPQHSSMAFHLYSEYFRLDGQEEALYTFNVTTDNFNL